MKTIIWILVLALVAWGVWALVDNDDVVAPADNQVVNNDDSGAAGGIELATQEFTVDGTSFSFTPNKIEVFKGDKIKINFNNKAGTHDMKIEGYNVGTKVLQAGESESFEFIADKSGAFEFYCSVGNHRAQGMKGSLVVKEVPVGGDE